MPRRVAQLLCAALLALGGCSSTDAWVAYDEGYREPCGGSWATVFPGPLVLASTQEPGSNRWYSSRCDTHLSERHRPPVLATRDWPSPPRPSIDHPRYVRVVRSPEVFIHYRTWRHHGHHHSHDYHWHGR